MTTAAFAIIEVNIKSVLEVLHVSMPLESTCHGHTAHGNASLGWRYQCPMLAVGRLAAPHENTVKPGQIHTRCWYQRPHVSLIYENLMNTGIIGPYCILSPRRYNARNTA